MKTRSHCEHCRRALGWVDLIPVFSYVFLGGKCRYCRKHIGYFYPVVELLTGVLFLFTALYLIPDIQNFLYFDQAIFFILLYHLFILSCLIVIFFTDFKYGIIPFKVVLTAIIITILYFIGTSSLVPHLLTGIAAGGFFFLLFIITRGKGLGFGDVVFAFLMGFVLGFPDIFVALYLAFLTGAIISLILVWSGRKKLQGGSIPFGPFLVTGTIISLFYGEFLITETLRYLI